MKVDVSTIKVDMHCAASLVVTTPIGPAKVLVDGQTNRVLGVEIIRAKRDALFG